MTAPSPSHAIHPNEPIAIIGAGCVLPDAPDVESFWNNLLAGRNSIRDVPLDRWDPALFYSEDRKAADKTYAKIGGFIADDAFDGLAYRMPPNVVAQVDASQRWALAATRQALAAAGLATGLRGDDGRDFDRDRCAVILGNAMGGEIQKAVSKRLYWPEVAAALRADPDFQALPDSRRDAVLSRVEESFKATTNPVTEDTMPGHLSNVAAGRIANAFDLGGKNFTTDAACASSFAALDGAMETLRRGENDLVVWGGSDRSMDVTAYIQFSKIGALSPDGSRPFDEGANGFVMGEGCAMFILKRLSDAIRDGDEVIATVRGMGGSSDGKGKGITAPNPAGQVKAVRRAYAAAGIDPATIGYLEAHGTSTPVGDPTELESVASAFAESGANAAAGTVVVGSVKSNIGHLKAAAGAAGLLKAALILKHGRIPPSLNVERLNPRIDWANTPFTVAQEVTDFPRPAGHPRRAAVSSFGFGGTNFHVVLEEATGHYPADLEPVAVANAPATAAAATPVFDAGAFANHMAAGGAVLEAEPVVASALDAPSLAAELGAITYSDDGNGPRLRDRLHAVTANGIIASERVAFAVGTTADIPKKLATAGRAMADPKGAGRLAFNQGVFLGQGKPKGKVAFLFPGQGTQYVGMCRDLAAKYRVVADTFAEADRVLETEIGCKLTDVIWPTPDTPENRAAAEAKLRLTEFTQPAVLAADVALLRLLRQWGVAPDVVAGHSLGEYGALVAADVLSFEDALHAVAARGREMASVKVPDLGKMASISGDWQAVEAAIAGVDGYVIPANKNCPSQTVIAGASDAVLAAMQACEAQGLAAMELPVSAAFHSDIVAPASGPLRNVLGRLDVNAPQVRVISNVGANDYPDDPDAIRDNLAKQVASPVEWIGIMERMFDDGVRTFIEVGPKKALTGFALDILKGRDGSVAIASNHPKKGGIAHVNELFAFLGAWGFEPQLPSLDDADVYTDAYLHPKAAFTRQAAAPAAAPAATTPTAAPVATISGVSIGLPGRNKPVFAEDNFDRILRGDNLIDPLPASETEKLVAKRVTRLRKGDDGSADFEPITDASQVIRLAGQAGSFDAAEFGIPADLAETLDRTTQYAMAAGIDALRNAGIPLVQTWKTTSTGSRLPGPWVLPASMRDDTGIIFASAFPGHDALLREVERIRAGGEFDRRFLFHVLAMGHSQFAQFIGARGPNTQVNAACASTTQAVSIAEDWIKAGRARRVIVVGADDVTSDAMFEWIGAGFLAAGAATTKDNVAEAALPFDRRRHGMIVGMGAVGLVIEGEESVRERGMQPIARLLATRVANSAFHGSRLDVEHIASLMQEVVGVTGLDPATIAPHTLFMSHETYTPARGGSASAEIAALRAAFGPAANQVTVANTKGFTGHPQGAGVEDAIALKCLQRGRAPPIANFRDADPELGDLKLSDGGELNVRYALRLAAGFGSQVAMTMTELVAREDERVSDAARYQSWLETAAGAPGAATFIENRQLRLAADAVPAPATPAPEPVAVTPVAAPVDDVLARLTGLVADKTGYPTELLEPDLDMEADLGIDTVKQAELFGMIREAYNVPLTEGLQIKDYPTLRAVADYISSQVRGAATGADPSAAAPAAADQAAPDVLATLTALVAEKTGYPIELLEPDLDMEADLGIDTVKQAELFGMIRDAYNVPLAEGLHIKDYPTLRAVADYIGAHVKGEGGAPVAPATSTPEHAAPANVPAVGGEVLATLTNLVAEKTGYPIELLEPDLDMEADLGIDTVKQAELFGMIREAYNVSLAEGLQIKDYPTLRAVADYIASQISGPATSTPAAPPTAATEPPAGSATTTPDVLQTLVGLVAEKTGYPVELLEPDLDMEADLGIDTVKQAELFGMIREAYDVPLAEGLQIKDYPTLRAVADYIASQIPADSTSTTRAGQQPTDATPAATAATAAAEAIVRREPRLREALTPAADNGITPGPVLAIGDFDREFLDAWNTDGFSITRRAQADEPLAGILYLATRAGDAAAASRCGELFDAAKANQDRLGAGTFVAVVTRQDGGHGFTAVSDPAMGAVAGVGKSLAKELPDAVVKVIDVHPAATGAGALVQAEILNGGPRTEVCFDGETERFEVDVAEAPLSADLPNVAGQALVVSGGAQGITVELLRALAPQAPRLLLLGRTPQPDDAATWADWSDAEWSAEQQRIIAELTGRGERPTPVVIQKALDAKRKAADVYRNLNALQAAGAEVLYAPVDVTDAAAVAEAVAWGREHFGRIDGVLHAAGVEISKDLASKSREQFDMVLGIKVAGWDALMAATRDDDLAMVAAFTSVAGRFGNIGQTDYAGANEYLAKAVRAEAARRGADCGGFTIAWGPWGEVGMATKGSIMQIMESSGVTPIPTADGVRHFLAEWAHATRNGGRAAESVVAGELGAIDADGQIIGAEAVVADVNDSAVTADGGAPTAAHAAIAASPARFRLIDDVTAFAPGRSVTATVTLDAARDPYLGDHSIDGVPYFPGVFGLEAFAAAASLIAPSDAVVREARNVRFASPLKQLKGEGVTATLTATLQSAEEEADAEIACRLTTQFVGPDGRAHGEPRLHCEATLVFGEAPAPDFAKTPVTTRDRAAADIYQRFFHGPTFQVLGFAGPIDDVAVGRFARPDGAQFAAGEAAFLTHPMVNEALFQLAGLHAMDHGRVLALPAGIGRLEILETDRPAGEVRLQTTARGKGDDGLWHYDTAAITTDGRVVARMTDFTLVETGPAPLPTETAPDAPATDAPPMPDGSTTSAGDTLSPDTPSIDVALRDVAEAPPIPAGDVALPEVPEIVLAAVRVVADQDCEAQWFTAAERTRHADFPAPKRADEWRAGRLAVKQAVCSHLPDLSPLDVEVDPDDQSGLPRLRVRGGRVPLHVSITHRAGVAIAALSEAPIGIDLEVPEERDAAWLQESFNDLELANLMAADDPEWASTCMWAAKEAVFKRAGTGLATSLREHTVAADGDGGARVDGPLGSFGVQFWEVDNKVFAVTAEVMEPRRTPTEIA